MTGSLECIVPLGRTQCCPLARMWKAEYNLAYPVGWNSVIWYFLCYLPTNVFSLVWCCPGDVSETSGPTHSYAALTNGYSLVLNGILIDNNDFCACHEKKYSVAKKLVMQLMEHVYLCNSMSNPMFMARWVSWRFRIEKATSHCNVTSLWTLCSNVIAAGIPWHNILQINQPHHYFSYQDSMFVWPEPKRLLK